MKKIPHWVLVITPVVMAVLGGRAISAQDKYTVAVPNGLGFSEFRGYETWEVVALSHAGDLMAVIVANPTMIDAYKAGIPGNGKPFPNGSKMAKIHWKAKTNDEAPSQPQVTGDLHDVDFMVKDSERFADSGGWGYGAFMYDTASDAFRPYTLNDEPPQAQDAKYGFACHTIVEKKDFVFTAYARR